GTVTGVAVDLETVIVAFDGVVALYTDSVGHPGTQVGGGSDPLTLDTAGEAIFTWSSGGPVLAADTDYWVVLSDSLGGPGQVGVRVANSQGPAFASGRHDTIAGIGEGTGGFST